MVLQAAYALASNVLPTDYYWPTAVGVASLVVTYAFAQGKTTNRERDLHARTILITVSPFHYSPNASVIGV